jgi:murein DD-endopeptidase MepM/ murein hydrolase activator NlpD
VQRRGAILALILLVATAGVGFRVLASGTAVVAGDATRVQATDERGRARNPTADTAAVDGSPARVADPLGSASSIAARIPPAPATLTGYRWPMQHARLTNAFGRARAGSLVMNGYTFHDGIDIASFCGDRIVAAHDGTVLSAGRRYDRFLGWVGNLDAYLARLEETNGWGSLAIAVVIDDGNGYRSVYVHFRKIVVKAGQVVHAGDLLGYEGATGYATGCHLHYGLFSPDETATLDVDPKLVERIHLPAREIARIDPLLVMPPMAEADITWGWGAQDFR